MSATLSAHPYARDAHQRRRIARDADADHDAALLLARGRTPKAAHAAFDRRCCGASASPAIDRSSSSEAAAVRGLGLVRSLAQALRLWSWGDVACDLVVLDSEPKLV